MKVKLDKFLVQKLLNLKDFVENLSRQPDIALRGGVYKELAKADIMTITHDNWVIGYKVIPHAIHIFNPNKMEDWTVTRRIFVKVEGYKLEEIPEEQSNPIMVAVFDVFLDRQQEAPSIELIAPDALRIEQVCVPLASRMPVISEMIQ